jgi:small nuclear ribonucleoprotein (snRNP)-like protein
MSGEDTAMDKAQANNFLNGLLNQPLRMTVTDGRSFIGNFMCTDRDAAVILSDTWEYRGSMVSLGDVSLAYSR